eukprot:CAMPEP_0119284614 /NCGR_PEP_ID=MMETSP1329-20130426/30583_1 /TAXON_ID=114041 /ORGANISM="Genus nov. species nov., Strain RCC1024" /LENGTH=419 /DNA_ID=CAMNT_0007285297 /DNA_START=80 /DNA_END=1336 /DNA_ORIENTATION=-
MSAQVVSDDVQYSALEGEAPDAVEKEEPAENSVFTTVAVVANAMKGSGLLALPYAYSRAGLVVGPLLLVFAGVLNLFTMHLVSVTGRHIAGPKASFNALAAATLPASLWWILDATVLMVMIMVDISYLIIIGNLSVVAASPLASRAPGALGGLLRARETWVTVGLIVVAPYSYAKTVGVLKHTNALGLFLVVYVAALAAFSWVEPAAEDPCGGGGHHCGGDYELAVPGPGALVAFSLATMSYCAQTQIPPAANGLKDFTQKKFDMCCGLSVTLCLVLYMLVGHAGYETFGSEVSSDFLESYAKSPAVTAARIVVALTVATSFPLMVVPFRSSLAALCEHQSYSPALSAFAKQRPETLRYASTTGFLAVVYVISLVCTDLGLVLSVVGATAGTALAYLGPTYAYCVTFRDDPSKKGTRLL